MIREGKERTEKAKELICEGIGVGGEPEEEEEEGRKEKGRGNVGRKEVKGWKR